MIEDLLNSQSYKAYKFRSIFLSSIFKVIYIVFFIGTILSLIYIVLNAWGTITFAGFKGIAYFLTGISALLFVFYIFVNFGTKQVSVFDISKKSSKNLFDYFSEENLKLMEAIYDLCQKNNISSFNLLCILPVLSQLDVGRAFIVRTEFYIDAFYAKQIISEAKSQGANANQATIIADQNKKFFAECVAYALKNKHKKIEFSDLIMALYKNNSFFAHVLDELHIKESDLALILSWNERMFKESQKIYFWQKDYYPAGIGEDWASGYTPNLNMFSVDISQYLLNAKMEYQSRMRQEVIVEMEDILSKSGRNNVLLVGDPGVGKTTLVNILAQKIIRGKSYPNLNYKHVVQLDISRILAGVSSKGELEARFLAAFDEAQHAGNIILFVKNIDQLIGNYLGEIGTVNASEFLLPYLESGKVQVVATITYDNFKGKMQANTNLEPLFNKIEIKEMIKEEVLPSIENLISYIEIEHRLIFAYQAVKQLIELAARYIHDEPFPQKAADLLSELGITMEKQNKRIVGVEEVNEFISHRIKMPVGKVKEEEKEKLLNIEVVLHKRVIGQDEAILAISDALRRARAGLAGKNRPIGSFLFIGPTGVGKTETARALAEAYFGSEKNMIRFDMSEFQEIGTIDRLIGTKSGSQYIPGRLTQGVQNNPYTLILFDEIEKAHPNVLNLLLQVLDEGRLTDAAGKLIDFTNTIIICTSNAGSEKIRQYLEKNISVASLGKIIIDYLLRSGIFKPEFINRFDKVVCYKPLTPLEVAEIVKLMINKLYKDLQDKNIKLEISQGALDELAQKGFDPVFGARPLRRLIQEKVENFIAKKIISGELKEGETIKISENEV